MSELQVWQKWGRGGTLPRGITGRLCCKITPFWVLPLTEPVVKPTFCKCILVMKYTDMYSEWLSKCSANDCQVQIFSCEMPRVLQDLVFCDW